jgi:cytochrome c oxidase subunit 2
VLAPAGPGARALAHVGIPALVVFSAATLVVWALLAWAAARRRGTLEEHGPPEEGGGHGWILIGGVVIPVVVFAALFVITLRGLDEFPLHGAAAHEPEIRVVGRQWWWQVEYPGDAPSERIVTANEIHLPVGQPVELALESRDVIHSLWIPELHGKVDLVPGIVNHVTLQADRPGTFLGQCAEYCGAEHALMRLTVVAQTRADFARWVQLQKAPAHAPSDPVAQEGRVLFEERACGLCHKIRGTRALGTVGPDLTHLASRQRIAANSLPNQHAYLMAWSTRAQSFKPGVLMPDLTDFRRTELDSLARYLEQLK